MTPRDIIEKNCVGEFDLSTKLMDTAPGAIVEALKGMIIVRCECLWMQQVFRYVAYSEHFKPITHGLLAPRYAAEIHQPGPNKYIIVFKESQL